MSNSAGDKSYIKSILKSDKFIIIVGGNRTIVSNIVLDQLQDLSENTIKDLHQYSDPLPNEEVVAAIILQPGEKITTFCITMRGWSETDKEALNLLINCLLQQIINNKGR